MNILKDIPNKDNLIKSYLFKKEKTDEQMDSVINELVKTVEFRNALKKTNVILDRSVTDSSGETNWFIFMSLRGYESDLVNRLIERLYIEFRDKGFRMRHKYEEYDRLLLQLTWS
jgi:hypothetical protein